MWYRISGRKETKYWYNGEEKTLMGHLYDILPHLDPDLDSVRFFYLKGKIQNLMNTSDMSLEEILDKVKYGELFKSYQQGRF